MVHLTPADISNSAGAQAILDAIRTRWPWVKHLFADGACDRLKLMDKAAYLDLSSRSSAAPTSRKASRSCPPLGGRTDLRLDDPLAATGARLRSPHRRVRSNDPRRHGRQHATPHHPSVSFQTTLDAFRFTETKASDGPLWLAVSTRLGRCR